MALDLSRPVTPPPAKKQTPAAKNAQKRTAAKTRDREDAVNGLFQLSAVGLTMFGQTADAGAFALHGPNVARETAALADENAQVARVLDYITGVGPYAALLTAMMPLVLQLLANHKKVPAEVLSAFGVMSPDALEAKGRAEALARATEMQNAETEALREFMQAQTEAQHANGNTPNSEREPVSV